MDYVDNQANDGEQTRHGKMFSPVQRAPRSTLQTPRGSSVCIDTGWLDQESG